MEKLLHYCRDWGEWPLQRGHTNQVRMFFAREPQTAGLNGDGLSFARHMFNYTTTFQRDADIFYPYGHAEKLATPKNIDRKSTRLNSSHQIISYAVFCLKKKKQKTIKRPSTTRRLPKYIHLTYLTL